MAARFASLPVIASPPTEANNKATAVQQKRSNPMKISVSHPPSGLNISVDEETALALRTCPGPNGQRFILSSVTTTAEGGFLIRMRRMTDNDMRLQAPIASLCPAGPKAHLPWRFQFHTGRMPTPLPLHGLFYVPPHQVLFQPERGVFEVTLPQAHELPRPIVKTTVRGTPVRQVVAAPTPVVQTTKVTIEIAGKLRMYHVPVEQACNLALDLASAGHERPLS